MKKITSLKTVLNSLSHPVHFGLLIGGILGLSIMGAGRWALGPAQKSAHQELALLAQSVAEAYVVSYPRKTEHKDFLKTASQAAVGHVQVVNVVVLSDANEIISVVEKRSPSPLTKTAELTHVIRGEDGSTLGIVTLGLNEKPGFAVSGLKSQIGLMALFGFLIGFALAYGIAENGHSFLPNLIEAFKQVSSGQYDVALYLPEDEKFSSVVKAFNMMTDGLRERERMKHSLGRIMDPKIAEILIKEDPKLGGFRRQATILFCDIRNYTPLCEQLTPDELQVFLNEYWKGTVEIIMEQEGTIDKFHGDGVCVVFGAPNLHVDDPLRAVRVAWRLIQNVDELNKKREAERKIPVQIGIGIHSGEVIAGHIGSERRMDYTVVGDAVNVAARIEELNKKYGTKILISDNVYERVEEHVRVKTLTLAHLRGHTRPILVHTVREFLDSLQIKKDLAA